MGGSAHAQEVDTTPPKMHISNEELQRQGIPLCWRDYCAHLLPALNKCRHENFYLPWKCEMERMAWKKCQYDDYQRRMYKLQKRRAKLDEERKSAVAAELDS
ncbi:NADH-ubiquinone oxidoreductase B18 subunit-domain-containing protein [Phlyctochytrium arcticum]|nr:NADH-ubiquinone oxidoreductase B18 subunit-domain-containing protein [Phlyctochytrium arcticum]